MANLAKGIMRRSARVYYFERKGGTTRDISELDPGKEESGEGGWGRPVEFSRRANAEVAYAVTNAGREERS